MAADWGIIDSAEAARRPVEEAALCHRTLLPNNVLIYEFVANIDQLPPVGYTIYGLPLKIHDSCGAPVRMIAVPNPEGWQSGRGVGVRGMWGLVVAAVALVGFM